MSPPKIPLSLSEANLYGLFWGGSDTPRKGDDAGLALALNALDDAAAELMILGEAVTHGTDDHGYTYHDLGARIHHVAFRLKAASELAQSAKGRTIVGESEAAE